jgi:alpha-D-xyloside xylohydrolase
MCLAFALALISVANAAQFSIEKFGSNSVRIRFTGANGIIRNEPVSALFDSTAFVSKYPVKQINIDPFGTNDDPLEFGNIGVIISNSGLKVYRVSEGTTLLATPAGAEICDEDEKTQSKQVPIGRPVTIQGCHNGISQKWSMRGAKGRVSLISSHHANVCLGLTDDGSLILASRLQNFTTSPESESASISASCVRFDIINAQGNSTSVTNAQSSLLTNATLTVTSPTRWKGCHLAYKSQIGFRVVIECPAGSVIDSTSVQPIRLKSVGNGIVALTFRSPTSLSHSGYCLSSTLCWLQLSPSNQTNCGCDDCLRGDKEMYSGSLLFDLAADEEVYGFGQTEHENTDDTRNMPPRPTLNIKPQHMIFEESSIYRNPYQSMGYIPFYQSSRGYAFLWNMPGYGYVDVANTSIQWVANSAHQLDLWITTTSASTDLSQVSAFPELMANYADSTGHSPMMPEWAMGWWQCKNRYRSQQEVLDVARGYHQRNVNISMIVIDAFSWAKWGDWTFDPNCWPDPAAMIKELNSYGIEVGVSPWPYLNSEGSNFSNFSNNWVVRTCSNTDNWIINLVDGYCICVDPFNPKARAGFMDAMFEGYLSYGIKFFWLDGFAPHHMGDNAGQWYFSPDGTADNLLQDEQVASAYPLMAARTFYEGLQSRGYGSGDIITLHMDAWAGMARYGAALWSGDVESTFVELRTQIRVALSVMMSGVPWWTSDIGGYGYSCMPCQNVTDPAYQQLFVRWVQFGAFCPVMRTHGWRTPSPDQNECGVSGGDNEIWAYGPEAETILADTIALRNSLKPYITTHMKITADTGLPMMRPLFFDFPLDACSKASQIQVQDTVVDSSYLVDQYMFGPDFLVAPVLELDAMNRTVCLPMLPAGDVWRHWYTNETYVPKAAGLEGQIITVDTPLNTFPLFVRGSTASTLSLLALL